MGLLLFAVIFGLCNLGLYFWAKIQLSRKETSNIFIKGTVRGYLGRFDTDDSLEKKRIRLKKKGSKF